MRSIAVLIVALTLLAGCGDAPASEPGNDAGPPLDGGASVDSGSPVDAGPPPWPLTLFEDPSAQTPAEGVEPYEIVAPLFSDYAWKHRFIRLPEGTQITVQDDGRWEFPVGTVLVKTFGFPVDARDPSLGERLVETRLLIREEARWRPEVYLWNEDETVATLTPAGRIVPVEFIDAHGETVSLRYRVPSHTQCRNCHAGSGTIRPLGPRTAQMDRVHAYEGGEQNQIDRLVELGWLAARPADPEQLVDYEAVLARPDAPFEELDRAARSYLHANCSHCHRDGGPADQSGLFLEIENDDPGRLGACKITVAGGCDFGRAVIHPGVPEDSMMLCRMRSTEPGVKMPELPAVLAHIEGAALIERWIAAMPREDCGFGD